MARTARSKHRRKARRNGSKPWPSGLPSGRPPGVPWQPTKKNPSGSLTDTAIMIGTGFGGFAVTRAAARITTAAVSRRYPRAGKHAGVLMSAALSLASWLGGHRVKWIAPYAAPITFGAGLGFLQTAFQTYFPARYAWLIGHDVELPSGIAHQPQELAPAAEPQGSIPAGQWYTYNDAEDAGRYAAPESAIPEEQGDPSPVQSMDDMLRELDDEESDLERGIFGGN